MKYKKSFDKLSLNEIDGLKFFDYEDYYNLQELVERATNGIYISKEKASELLEYFNEKTTYLTERIKLLEEILPSCHDPRELPSYTNELKIHKKSLIKYKKLYKALGGITCL
jgi:hypothetical protein